ncbi:MAG: sigma-54 dependent transcriptional regulator [Gemmatimonadales bacterium]|nr:sigma-54 dependent transcriptional regulator [Gemmatimonadales bacterium]
MSVTGTLLVVEDERTLGRAIELFLREHGWQVELAPSAEAGLEAFERLRPDVVISDVRLPGMPGTTLLERLLALDPAVPVVLMTAHGTIEGAVSAVKRGAFDYLKKPVDLEELRLLAERAVAASRERQELSFYRRQHGEAAPFGDVVGDDPAFRAVLERARQVASLPETPPILLTGETGTGKGLVARTIHASSPRAAKPFIDVNCTTLPASLAEAELFGHERGAFTDAKQTRIGLFEAADGGFLFLDEIGDLELAIQGKLLKAIEDGVVRRVGASRDRAVDVRIVAATHRDLEREAARDRFRRDLFFRLAVIPLRLPALRERGDDVLRLAEHYLQRHAAKYGRPGMTFAGDVRAPLRRYPWPGNVRELSHVIERAVLWSAGEEVTAETLAMAIGPGAEAPGGSADGAPDAGAAGASALPPPGTDLETWERRMLEEALRETAGNQTRAAQRLGITRDTLRYRMKKWGLGG